MGRVRSAIARLEVSAGIIACILCATAGGCTGYLQGPVPCDGAVDGDAGDADSAADAHGDTGADATAAEPYRVGPVCYFIDLAEGAHARERGENFVAHYVEEVLGHAGLPFRALERIELTDEIIPCPTLIVAHSTTFSATETSALERAVAEGMTLIALGGTSGLDSLLGVEAVTAIHEGYIRVDPDAPLTAPPLPLHVFRGVCVELLGAEAVGAMLDEDGTEAGCAALTRRELEEGVAWLIGADIFDAIVTIQQGRPIAADGEPAPDGTASIDDGILKTDDGIALSWDLDRDEVAGSPLFLEPIADHLRELLLQIILQGHQRRGARLPLLWYWPGGLNTIGVISHDTDHNNPGEARILIEQLQALELESTWCFIQYPELYPAELFGEVAAAGGEISFHFDARTPDNPATTWSEANFNAQLGWLESISGHEVTTNKNHYLRWEGWTEFYRWCEAAGIQADQSKGPSKSGNVGFLYGTSHPHLPVDDVAHDNRFLDVLAIDLLSQDLLHTCPYEFGPALLERAISHHGVAHFLFHPAHTDRPEVAEAMASIVTLGRDEGLEWWTVARINEWERARRNVRITQVREQGFTVHTTTPLLDATFLVVVDDDADELHIHANDTPVTWSEFTLHGADTARFTLDLEAGETEIHFE